MARTDLLVEISDDNFEQEIGQHDGLALVDFWAAWCAPCQIIAPVVAQLAEEYSGKLKVGKMDVDANPKTPMQFSVRSIPTLVIFKDGAPVDIVVGAVPKPHLVEKIEQHLAA